MTIDAPAVPPQPRGALGRLGWALADGWTITLRDLTHWVRQPGQIIVALLFPVMVVLIFGYVFGGGMVVPGGGDYREFLMPGMFAMTMVFGIESTFTAVAGDIGKGVTDRFRSLPMARSAVVTGRAAADMLNSVLGLAAMIACGLAVGWRWHNGPAAALAAVGLLLLLRFALLWTGVYMGLVTKSPEAVMAVQILVWPLGFLSNTFASTATMPGWLAAIADWNPMSATVSATRELFGNPGWGGDSFAAQHAMALALLWPAVLLVIFFPLSVRRYRDLSR
ncbi:ABC transporter permease [Sphaerisporangium aureirubrum]|uniref:Transport permease protein n=1 Tax=Sphaerisporangium aureirubrum TaxID=1544736 RepID=A0ABW1NWG0_9ACTN